MSKHTKMMEHARICSHSSLYQKYKIGSVIVLKNGKKYFGFNQPKSHPMQDKFSFLKKKMGIAKANNSYIHAEMHALVVALRNNSVKDLEGGTIYVYRTDLNGNHAMCRPCVSCMAAIKHYKIKHVYYTTNDSEMTHEILS